MAETEEGPITLKEIIKLFESEVQNKAIKLLLDMPEIGLMEVRRQLRAMAAKRKGPGAMTDLTCPKCGPGAEIVRTPGTRTATCVGCGIGRHVTAFKAPPAGTTPLGGGATLRDVWPVADQPRPGGKRSFEKRP